jgi:hypothetical protein
MFEHINCPTERPQLYTVACEEVEGTDTPEKEGVFKQDLVKINSVICKMI